MKLIPRVISTADNVGTACQQPSFFRFTLSARNWTGNTYITKEDCKWFSKELKKMDDRFYDLFEERLHDLNIEVMLDVSVFTGRSLENTKLIEFLEELDDFYHIDKDDVRKNDIAHRYMKKMEYYTNKFENTPYLYRWAFSNKNHPFTDKLLIHLDEKVASHGKKLIKFLEKARIEWGKFHEKLMEESETDISELEQFKLLKKFLVRKYKEIEKLEEDFAEKVFKYALDEPSLFYFAMYVLILYNQNVKCEELQEMYRLFLFFEKPQSKLNISVKRMQDDRSLVETYYENEHFIDYLSQMNMDENGTVHMYHSLEDMCEEHFSLGEEVIQIIKTLTTHAFSRIPKERMKSLPYNGWMHEFINEFFRKNDLNMITLQEMKMIAGKESEEVLVRAIVTQEDGKRIMFPLYSPDTWDGLSSLQCVVLAYGICLYHDICTGNKHQLYEILLKDYKEYLEESFGARIKNTLEIKRTPMNLRSNMKMDELLHPNEMKNKDKLPVSAVEMLSKILQDFGKYNEVSEDENIQKNMA